MKIAVISDIHEDIVSLELAFAKIEKLNVDSVFCLGDISGFTVPFYLHQNTRNASKCLDLIRKNCELIIPGNHDLNAARIIPEVSVDFDYPADWYDLDYSQKKKLSNGLLWLYEENELNPLYSRDDLAFLTELAQTAVFKANDEILLLSHYAFPNISGMIREFYHDVADYELHFEYMIKQKCNIGVIGHHHAQGLHYYTKSEKVETGFRRKALPFGEVVLLVPSITNRGESNGFLIIDTLNLEIEAIKI